MNGKRKPRQKNLNLKTNNFYTNNTRRNFFIVTKELNYYFDYFRFLFN